MATNVISMVGSLKAAKDDDQSTQDRQIINYIHISEVT